MKISEEFCLLQIQRYIFLYLINFVDLVFWLRVLQLHHGVDFGANTRFNGGCSLNTRVLGQIRSMVDSIYHGKKRDPFSVKMMDATDSHLLFLPVDKMAKAVA